MPLPSRDTAILQINVFDRYGGAERTVLSLHRAYLQRGCDAWLAVQRRFTDVPGIFEVPNDASRGPWTKGCHKLRSWLDSHAGCAATARRLSSFLNYVAEPRRRLRLNWGGTDYDWPGTYRLLDLVPRKVDIIHCHNLHGRYFDLRALPWLASSAPLIVTLHDNWPLTGFCAYPFDCQKWRSGCGRCPELACLPKPPHDRTATDWRIKRDIFQRCRVYVAAPSRWMLDRAKTSLLAPAIIDSRVIPNGVDLRVFTAGDQTLARQALGIPEKAWVLLAAAKSLGKNANKDHQTLQQAVAMTSEQLPPGPIILLALGAEGLSPRLGRAEVRCVPFVNEDKALVQYYRAADIFLHSARQEVFGNVLVESMACGTPVIASAVGGVSEILDNEQSLCLYPPGDAPAMATRIRNLLIDGDARRDLALRGIELVHKRYSLETQVTAYLEWYAEILNTSRHPAHQEHAGGRHPFRHRRNMP